MKKYCLFLTIFVLTLSLFTGCGCSPQKETEPVLPTRDTTPMIPETLIPTTPSEEATTLPESMPAESGMDGAEGDTGNGGQNGGQTGGQNGGNGTSGDMTDSTSPGFNDMARGRGMR